MLDLVMIKKTTWHKMFDSLVRLSHHLTPPHVLTQKKYISLISFPGENSLVLHRQIISTKSS